MPYLSNGTRVDCTNLEIEGVRRGTLMSRNGGYHNVLLDNGIMVERYENELKEVTGEDTPPAELPLPYNQLDAVRAAHSAYIESLITLVENITVAHSGFWQHVVRFTMHSGVTMAEIEYETGACSKTISKWLDGMLEPKSEGTRRLMKGAMIALLKTKLNKAII